MKLNILKATLLAGLIGISSCSDDYLETSPTQLLASSDINEAGETRPMILIGFLNGLYSTLYDAGSGGTTNHDDFGQKGYDIYMDMMSQDVALEARVYGWYSRLADFSTTQDYTDTNNYKAWRFYYRIIYSANDLIAGFNVEENGLPTDAEARANLGQALALRAYCYYNLSLMYVNDIHNMSAPALPIYTVAGNEAHGLSTMGEVYDLMINDLSTSVDLLDGFERDAKFRINQDVAQGLLAYVYAAKGEDTNAANAAKAVIDRGRFPLMSKTDLVYDATTRSGGGFNNVNNPSWMWGQDLTTDIGLDLISWWGQMDVFTYSYTWAGDAKVIDAALYDAIPADDIRKNQFSSDANPVPDYPNGMPSGKFFDPSRRIGGQREVETDYIYMRIEEMYLLYAEEAAKSGNEAEAKRVLKELMEIRVPDASYIDSLSGQALLDEILLQSRIELWGEGKSYALMKRNNQSRTIGANHLFFIGETISSTDPRLTFEIPISEIQNNPNISR